MATVHYLGKIFPNTHYSPTMWGLPTIFYVSPDTGNRWDLSIKIQDSSVDVECAVDWFDPKDLLHTHKLAYDMARAAANVMAFATGIVLAVIFDGFTDETGVTFPIATQALNLGKLCTAYALESTDTVGGLGDILKVIMVEPALFLALDDLITATSYHHLLTVNSARAIEGLRHAMAPGMQRSQQWQLFRENLNIGEDYIRLITDNSQSGRHGEGTYIPGVVTNEIIQRSWTIMNRFLEFRKSGNQPLDRTSFPTLC